MRFDLRPIAAGRPDAGADDRIARVEHLMQYAFHPFGILHPQRIVKQMEQGKIGAAAGGQQTAVRAVDGPTRRGAGGDNHVLQRHAQRQQFGQGGGKIPHRAVDRMPVYIGGNGLRQQLAAERRARHLKREGRAAVADIEDNPAVARLLDQPEQILILQNGAADFSIKAMGDDVPLAQQAQHVVIQRQRFAHVNHDRQLKHPAKFLAEFQRRQIPAFADNAAGAHFQPDDTVAIGLHGVV